MKRKYHKESAGGCDFPGSRFCGSRDHYENHRRHNRRSGRGCSCCNSMLPRHSNTV